MAKLSTPLELILVFLRLGLTSFGGPVAHLGYFRQEFVERRAWLNEHAYADLVALCQFLPGPASSQVGIAIGLSRGGVAGAIAAWLGFTLPSAILLVLFGLNLSTLENYLGSGWLHGLMIVAVAVVAQAVWSMGKTLCPDLVRATIATISAVVVFLIPNAASQVGAIIVGGIIGIAYFRKSAPLPHSFIQVPVGKKTGGMLLLCFFGLLAFLPILGAISSNYLIQMTSGFYRTGSLVFGGGHVVLPLLQAQVVPSGWVGIDAFLAGYGAAQAAPGPLFTFAAFLGAVSSHHPAGWTGASIALLAIFLPSFFLIIGVLPFWEGLRSHIVIQRAMPGINAAVVGILFAAFCNPVWTSTMHAFSDFVLAATAFLMLAWWKLPAWLVVILAVGLTGILNHYAATMI